MATSRRQWIQQDMIWLSSVFHMSLKVVAKVVAEVVTQVFFHLQ